MILLSSILHSSNLIINFTYKIYHILLCFTIVETVILNCTLADSNVVCSIAMKYYSQLQNTNSRQHLIPIWTSVLDVDMKFCESARVTYPPSRSCASPWQGGETVNDACFCVDIFQISGKLFMCSWKTAYFQLAFLIYTTKWGNNF